MSALYKFAEALSHLLHFLTFYHGIRIVSRFNAKTCTHVVWKAGSDRTWTKVIHKRTKSGIKVLDDSICNAAQEIDIIVS